MAVYIDGVEVLTAIAMHGTWTAVGTVTFPALTFGGDVSIGGNKLKTALWMLFDKSGYTDGLSVRNLADNAWGDVNQNNNRVFGDIFISTSAKVIKGTTTADAYYDLQARMTGGTPAFKTLVRLKNHASVPYAALGGSQEHKFHEDGRALLGGEVELGTAHGITDASHPHAIARGTYDFAVDEGAQGVIGLHVTIPDNAVIVRAWYDVKTTLQSAGDTATVSLDIPTDDVAGILAAIAINNGTPWDAGYHECIQDGAVGNFAEICTDDRELSMTVAVQDLTAGKFILYAEYVVSD